VKKRGLSACGECGEFPCAKYADREKIEKDSFVSHKRMFKNQEKIRELGLDTFLARQADRVSFLEYALAKHDNGRNKNIYCIAAALLSVDSLQIALSRANTGENLRGILTGYAANEVLELKLTK
jgi:hypothetical protein